MELFICHEEIGSCSHLEGTAQDSLLSRHVTRRRANPSREWPEEVRQKLILVVDVRQVAFARKDVERRHHVVLAVGAEPDSARGR